MLGYLDNEYKFVVPDFDLKQESEEKGLNLDSLNFLKALSSQRSEYSARNDWVLGMKIIREIVTNEVSKFKNAPRLCKVIKKILNWDLICKSN